MVGRLLRVLERSRWLAICMGVLALLGLTLGTSAPHSDHARWGGGTDPLCADGATEWQGAGRPAGVD